MRLEINVVGLKPEPQGSKSAVVRGDRAVVIEGKSTKSRVRYADWRREIRKEADVAVATLTAAELELLATKPLAVSIVFYLPRPRAHYRSVKKEPVLRDDAPVFHTFKPDVDKLVRAVLDALTGHVYKDDSTVAVLHTRKVYVHARYAGAGIVVSDLPSTDEEARNL